MLDFLKHLRLNYQFLILSGPFLLGGLFSPRTELFQFLIQYISVHAFLFGGVTAYNSYWDKDEGPIGGLEHPPKMKKWMLSVSWALQFLGLLVGSSAGRAFVIFYLISVLFFWLYSSPHTRWKGSPLLSFIAIGVSTVSSSFALGYISFGGEVFQRALLLPVLGAMCLVLSMYPLSQLYQTKADAERGDTTFAVKYGLRGVRDSFTVFFFPGLLLFSLSFLEMSRLFSVISVLVGGCVGIYVYRVLRTITLDQGEYRKIMRLKYLSGLTFSCLMLVLLFAL